MRANNQASKPATSKQAAKQAGAVGIPKTPFHGNLNSKSAFLGPQNEPLEFPKQHSRASSIPNTILLDHKTGHLNSQNNFLGHWNSQNTFPGPLEFPKRLSKTTVSPAPPPCVPCQSLLLQLQLGTVAGFCLWQLDKICSRSRC